ncbi:MAG: hypothetical protein ACI8Z1_004078 [Candidatus Azotimanducaceae bacterium]|jgi:hypothetical protein
MGDGRNGGLKKIGKNRLFSLKKFEKSFETLLEKGQLQLFRNDILITKRHTQSE